MGNISSSPTRRQRPARFRAASFLVLLAGLLGLVPGVAQAQLKAPQWKAATLSKIIPYVNWPRSDQPVVVGLLGHDPFNSLLERLVDGQTAGGRAIQVRVVKDAAAIASCQILFVPRSQMDEWTRWSRNKAVDGILTVGEDTSFVTDHGGICSLSFETKKLEINRDNARQAGLKISSRLLKIAKLVRS